MNIWCIHGNLQLPSVWDCFDGAIFQNSKASPSIPLALHKASLWDLKEYSFSGWTASFLERVSTSQSKEKPWIMGYSLGGRLAWHAILEQPEYWKGGVIIAAHPGLSSPTERSNQLEKDKQWAGRFRKEPWEDLLKEWDQLPVFGGFTSKTKRREHEFSKETVARIFTGFSKAHQADLTPRLAKLNAPPLLYVSGELDEKYKRIGAALAAQCPHITHVSIPEACHRVPWENSAEFIHAIQYFIDSVP